MVAPQLYGTTYTFFAHILPTQGLEARLANDDPAASMAQLIDENTRAVFCETSATRPATSWTSRPWPPWPSGIPLIVDNTVATPIC